MLRRGVPSKVSALNRSCQHVTKALVFRAKPELLQAPLHHRKTAEPQRAPLGEHVKAARISVMQGVEPCHGRCSAETRQAGFLRSTAPANRSQNAGLSCEARAASSTSAPQKNSRTSKGTLRGTCQGGANFRDARGRTMPWKVLCRGVPSRVSALSRSCQNVAKNAGRS